MDCILELLGLKCGCYHPLMNLKTQGTVVLNGESGRLGDGQLHAFLHLIYEKGVFLYDDRGRRGA